ncbi:MAG: LLM class flavin-dependent oxidoreductase [Streptosporangiales bacterium]|nr:LLM class flavin-dependent oxidoreductase [Streptosporangiales bacterium]MBO0892322.1 LLM class flavin-dependent oxidoreductase [Acidothermales bacterium]
MPEKAFRFAATMPAQQDATADSWAQQVRRVEELGYASLFHPDGVAMMSPFTSLPVAVAATSTLTVAPFVTAAPLRDPRLAAWEAHSLASLADGRFEFGIGTGHPGMREQAAVVGGTYGTGPERLARMRETVERFRALDGDRRTPVMIAAGGPQALAYAGAEADIVVLAHGPLTSREEVAAKVRTVRDAAGDRADELEFASNIMVVGDDAPPRVTDFVGADMTAMIEHDSLVIIRGTDGQMADELQRRRDEVGLNYVGVSGLFLERFAPVVERLAGK